MSRSPFGGVTFDSGNGGMAERVPVGFAGGIADDDVGLVHMQVTVYAGYDVLLLFYQECLGGLCTLI